MPSPLLAQHGLRDPVALGSSGTQTVADLLQLAARVAARLPAASPGSHVLLAVRADRFTFTAGLLGAWARGHTAALPPYAGRDWILRITQRPETAAVLHDTETDAPIRIDALSEEPGAPEPLALESIELPELPVTLFSGDPGHRWRAHPKRRSQLLDEAAALAKHFGLAPGFSVLCTVPPSQQLGLACGVLWPLVAGGSFGCEIALDEVAAALQTRPGSALVSVPDHLRRLERASPGVLARASHIVCSRGAYTGTAKVTELFGSTATGAVATGQRGRFRPLPEVRLAVAESGELLVDSPFLPDTAPRPYPTGDFVRMGAAGELTPLGRADELGLPEIDEALARVAGVADATAVRAADGIWAAVVPEAGAGATPLARGEPAAVGVDAASQTQAGRGAQSRAPVAGVLLAPHAEPPRSLERSHAASASAPEADLQAGRPGSEPRPSELAAEAELRARLRAAIPELTRILFVPRLPRTSTGRPRRNRVFERFGCDARGRPLHFELAWLSDRVGTLEGTREHVFQVHVPGDYGHFAGHFEGYPILPGAAQLSELVLPCVRRARPELGRLEQMARIKFSGRIQPDETIEVALRWRDGERSVDFTLQRAATPCATGRLAFADGAAR